MYAECGTAASPPNQWRCPPNLPNPNAFRFLLLEVSEHLGEKDVKNFKALVEDYGHKDDKGALTVEQLQGVTTTFSLLMESVKVGYIQPDNLSNLVAFLDISGHGALAQEIKDFQKKEQSESTLTFIIVAMATLKDERICYGIHFITHSYLTGCYTGRRSWLLLQLQPINDPL